MFPCHRRCQSAWVRLAAKESQAAAKARAAADQQGRQRVEKEATRRMQQGIDLDPQSQQAAKEMGVQHDLEKHAGPSAPA